MYVCVCVTHHKRLGFVLIPAIPLCVIIQRYFLPSKNNTYNQQLLPFVKLLIIHVVFLDVNEYQRLDYFSACQYRSPGVDDRVCLPLNNPLRSSVVQRSALGQFWDHLH